MLMRVHEKKCNARDVSSVSIETNISFIFRRRNFAELIQLMVWEIDRERMESIRERDVFKREQKKRWKGTVMSEES